MEQRRWRMAGLVADGSTIALAGQLMGLTKGEVSRCWKGIRAGLGKQAV
jgi:hypothetical protein